MIKLIKAFMVVLSFAVLGWMAFFHPIWLLWFAQPTVVLTVLIVALAIYPKTNIQFGDKAYYPFKRWLFQMFLLQGIVLILFIAVCYAFLPIFPTFLNQKLNLMAVTEISYQKIWQWGLFPWVNFALWGGMIAILAHHYRVAPYLYCLADKTILNKIDAAVKAGYEGTMTSCTLVVLGILIVTVINLTSLAVESLFQINHFILPILPFFLLSFIALFFGLTSNIRKITKYFQQRNSFLFIIKFLIVLIVPLLVMSALLSEYIQNAYPQFIKQAECKQCKQYFSNVEVKVRFVAFYWGWWLIITPLIGSYIAKISRGRTLRQLVSTLFITPLIVFVFAQFHEFKKTIMFLSYIPMFWSYLLLSIATAIILYCVIKKPRNSDFLISGWVKINENMPRDRLSLNTASKKTGIGKYQPRLAMMIIATIFLNLTTGWYGIQIQISAMAVLVLNYLYWGWGLYFFRLIRSKQV